MLTLGDLITLTGLDLELVTGDERALERPVAGAHSMETGDASRWLEPDWVLLTVGMSLRDKPLTQQRAVVVDAVRGRLAAIGFGVGIVFDDVPPGMLDEARKRNFPIFTVPLEAQFRHIVEFVHRSLDSEGTSAFHRAISLQRYLMDALSSEQPREELLTRLATSLQCDAAIFRYDGQVQLARGSLQFEEVWAEVTIREPRDQVFAIDSTQVLSFPLVVDGQANEWLVVAARRPNPASIVLREVSRSAARLLASIEQGRRIAVLEEQAMGARLLERLLTGEVAPADVDRLSAFGFNVAAGVRVAIVANSEKVLESPLPKVARLVDQYMITHHVPHLIAIRKADILVLSGEEVDIDALMEGLEQSGLDARAGVGRLVQRAEQIVTSFQDAGLGLARLERNGAPPGSVAYEAEFGLAEWLVRSADAEVLQERAGAVLHRLKEYPELYETLDVYLREDLNVKVAAHKLRLHPNSLRYRLKRIEELTGRRLDEAWSIVDLSLAILVERARESESRG